MGLDIYVGPLCRYYARDWELATQRVARELGVDFEIIRADDIPPPAVGDARVAVLAWRDQLQAGLGSLIDRRLNWLGSSHGDYFTDKPGWDGRNGVVLLAAQREFPTMSLPPVVPAAIERTALWDLVVDAHMSGPGLATRLAGRLFRRVERPRPNPYGHIYFPEMWLPVEMEPIVEATTLTGQVAPIGSIPRLRRQLEALNSASFVGSDEDLEAWSGDLVDEPTFEQSAKAGLATWLRLARIAEERHLPMVLDY